MTISTPDWLKGRLGYVEIAPEGSFEAGTHASVTLTYVAGPFGIDDTGGLRVVTRFATDMGKPQFDAPTAENYVTAEASNGAVLDLRYDYKGHIRPWDRTIQIRVVRGFLREGERIVVRLGDRRFGSPGLRMQTYSEENFAFKVFADPFATGLYAEAPTSARLSIRAGEPSVWKAVLPTAIRAGEPFRLGLRAEDVWGNPAPASGRTLRLDWHGASSLPHSLAWPDGQAAVTINGLSAGAADEVAVTVSDGDGAVLARSNPLRVLEKAELLPYWGDLHGQSGETIGTGTAEAYFRFARDVAFLDVAGHQGNDFQITSTFYKTLNGLTRRFNEPGRFVTLPGYEWSGNTGLGGDRNVYFAEEDDADLFRSSHALVADESDAAKDCHAAADLFARLRSRDAVVNAHVGGRYADIALAHDGKIERSVEIHSAWGTFEWLLHDAFDKGYRVGVVCNSDDHKGRPGASSPGASQFGAYGGLTCLLLPELSRPAVIDALRRRHHYGTTGARLHLDVQARFATPAQLFDDDPALGETASRPTTKAIMGDIVRSSAAEVELVIDILGSAPIERVEIRRGRDVLEIHRPYAPNPASRRLRVVMEGAEYRGRGRQTSWTGSARVTGNAIASAASINFWNPDRPLVQAGEDELTWDVVTTGNFAGFHLVLDDASAGSLTVTTPHATATVDIDGIGERPRVWEAGGLGRRLSIQRLPETLETHAVTLHRRLPLALAGDSPFWVSVVQEDGHQAWSSPIYLI